MDQMKVYKQIVRVSVSSKTELQILNKQKNKYFHKKNPGPDTDLFAGEIPWVILIAVSSLLVISACIVGLAICICRRNTSRNPPQQSVQCKNLIII